MKTGKTIAELYAELERQRNYRKDYIADTRTVKITTQNNIYDRIMVNTLNIKVRTFLRDRCGDILANVIGRCAL